MALFDREDREFIETAAALVTGNPFEPEWMQRHDEVLSLPPEPRLPAIAWQPGLGPWGPTSLPRVRDFGGRVESLADRSWEKLTAGTAASERDLALYEKLGLYKLYRVFGKQLDLYIDGRVRGERAGALGPAAIWGAFQAEHQRLMGGPGRRLPLGLTAEHVYACFFLFRRAFYHIFFNIIGTSAPAARLRSEVWRSAVTHDYFTNILAGGPEGMATRMKDFATLITGPSGTGKELVAQAIGRSQYIPFDPAKKAFKEDFLGAFQPVNVSALSPLLVESELFGHVKGAFTGAVGDRVGRLGDCPSEGAVFLDEVGELTGELQVKLLRVLQEQRFQRVGDNGTSEFKGKFIAATNRHLGEEVAGGRFREDFYYRLCADRVVTPSLREQLADRPEDLPLLVSFICGRVAGEAQAGRLCDEVVGWVEKNLGRGYAWPGNFRELEQCVRSYVIRREYRPLRRADASSAACAVLAEEVAAGRLSHAEIERRVFALVHGQAGSLQEAARLLGVDWRTLRARLGPSDEGKRRP